MSLTDRDQLERSGLMIARDASPRVAAARRFQSRLAARLLAAIALSAILFPTLASIASAQDFDGHVKPTALNVRSEPSAKSSIAGILLKSDAVTVTGERRVGKTRWYSIKTSGGSGGDGGDFTGWVAARFIARGEAPARTQEGKIDYGDPETPTLIRGDFKYVGVRVCADCHSDSTGDFSEGAVPVWQSHFHSQAHKTLQRDYTEQIAQRTRGVDDPATDWRCVKCHQTAFGAGPEQTASSYRPEEGVSCEVCHGPGSRYADEDHGPDVANREAMGFRVLRDLNDRREVCTSCHNSASPTFIGFDLREFSRKIAHWVDEDDAAYLAEKNGQAARQAKAMAEDKKTSKPGGMSASTASGAAAAATKAAQAAKQAAAEAARADAAAAKAASEAASIAAAKKADQALADAAAAEKMAGKNAELQKAARQKAAAEAAALKASADAAATQAAQKVEQAKADAAAAKEAADAQARKAAADAKAKKAAAKAIPSAIPSASPLAKYLDDVDDVILMNTDGKKYKSFKFPHRKHATGLLYNDIACQTCHHTQEDDESPQSCNECHELGGDADEEKTKKFYAHAKGLEFEGATAQEQISCASCHKAMNKLLAAGEREGEKAPVKCTQCHVRNKK